MAHALEDREIEVERRPSSEHPVHVERSDRRVRVMLGGETIADTTDALLMLEKNHLPVYYFPMSDVRMDLMERTDKTTRCPHKGTASYWTINVGDAEAANAVWAYEDPTPESQDIKGHVAFYWDKVDAWFEEDDEVFAHPRDPYHRVDVLHSSRHVRVVVEGETVAETRRPRLLFETGLPTRYYIPKLDVRMDLLEATDTHTRCPYKGEASYWSARVGDKLLKDLVWGYPSPIAECPKIENLVSFLNERVDIYVDGELQPRPKTPWS